MANRSLEWVIRMVDKFSAPAGKAGGAIDRMVKEVKKLDEAVGKGSGGALTKEIQSVEKAAGAGGKALSKEIGGEMTKLFKGLAGTEGGNLLGKVFSGMTGEALGMATAVGGIVSAVLVLKDVLGEVVHLFAEGVMKVAELTYELGKTALETASFKEQSLIAMGTVLGSDAAAKSLFKDTVRLAGALPIGTEQAVDLTKRFAVAGFRGTPTLQRMMIAASDVKAFRGEEGMEGFIRQMADMAAVGVQVRHMQFLSQQTGIREDLIFKHIRALTGAKGTDKQIEEMISKGLVSRSVGTQAVIAALSDMEHGPLGTLSVRLGQSFDGLLTRMKSGFKNLFLGFDKLPGFSAAKGVLSSLIDAVDPSKGGGELKTALGGALSSILTAAIGGSGGELGSFLAGLPEMITRIGSFLSEVAGGIRGFIEGFVDGIGPAFKAFIASFGGDGAKAARVYGAMIGEFLGWLSGWVLRIIKLFSGIAGIKGLADIQGVAFPASHETEAGAPGSAPAPSVNELSSRAPPVLHWNPVIHVHGDVKDPDALARRLEEVNRPSLQSWLSAAAASAAGAR